MGVDPSAISDWRECYIKTSRKPFSSKAVLSLKEAFSVMITLVSFYSYGFQDDVFELTTLINAMRSFPEAYENEWKLWEELFCELRKSGVKEKIR